MENEGHLHLNDAEQRSMLIVPDALTIKMRKTLRDNYLHRFDNGNRLDTPALIESVMTDINIGLKETPQQKEFSDTPVMPGVDNLVSHKLITDEQAISIKDRMKTITALRPLLEDPVIAANREMTFNLRQLLLSLAQEPSSINQTFNSTDNIDTIGLDRYRAMLQKVFALNIQYKALNYEDKGNEAG